MNEILEKLNEIQRTIILGSKKALNIDDLMLITGLSKDRIYKLVKYRQVPYYKSRGRLFFDKDEIESWMLKNRVPTQDETDSLAATYVATRK